MQELRNQLSSVEKKSTTLPKIEQVTPGRVVSASSGCGDTCDGSKRNKETVISARVEEEKKALVKLREMEEQLLAAKEDSERAAAEVGKMSQDLQDLKEVGRAKQSGLRECEGGLKPGSMYCVLWFVYAGKRSLATGGGHVGGRV